MVNEKNAVVESPKLNLTLAKAETKDMNYSELCRLFMWKLNNGIRKDALQTTVYSSFSFSWEIDFYG